MSRVFSLAVIASLVPFVVHAQTLEPDGFLAEILARTNDVAANFQGIAASVFFFAIAVNTVWIFGKLALSQGSFSDLMKELGKLVIFSGMVLALINAAPFIPGFILENAAEISERGSASASGKPGEIFSRLMSIAGQTTFSTFNPLGAPLSLIAGILIVIFAAGIAAMIVIAIIEAHLIGGIGVILLGFGAWDLTSDIAKSYLRWALGTMLKLVTVFMLAGIIVNITEDWTSFSFNPITNFENVLAVIGLMMISFIMIMVVPSTVQQIASGASFSSSAEAGMSSVKMVAMVGAAVGAKAAAPMAGGAVAGLGQAAGAATQVASAAIKTATSMAQGGTTSGGKADPKTVAAINKATGTK